jgi:hypothetical protein
MKTVHIHHEGQYWRGFKHGIFAVAIFGGVLAMSAGSSQRAHSQASAEACPNGTTFRGNQGSIVLCEAQPVDAHRLVQPMPTWWAQFPAAGQISGDTLRELDRHGLRPVSAIKAASCL